MGVRAVRVRSRPRAKGSALIELALVLPVLLVLVFGVVDFARAIQYSNVLVSISREGANLASRTGETPQNILRALVDTAAPLKMSTDGMVYLSRVVGRADGTGQIEAQYRAASGDTTLPSRLGWTCSTWVSNVCTVPNSRPVITLDMTLRTGETVYVVEALYDYDVLIRYVMKTAPQLYSRAVM